MKHDRTELEMFDLDLHTGEPQEGPERDEKGRVRPDLMSGRELLEEIVLSQRATHDLVSNFMEGVSTNPMMKMMMGKMGR